MGAPRLHIIPGLDRLYALAFATPSPDGWLIAGEREAGAAWVGLWLWWIKAVRCCQV